MPNQWKLNCLAFTVGGLYYIVKIYQGFDNVPVDLPCSTLITRIIANCACYLMNSKMKGLYRVILKNERLIAEMKKIIQLFPHGVLIHSEDTCFTNEEFDSNIKRIRERLEELDNVAVKFSDSARNNQSEHTRVSLLD